MKYSATTVKSLLVIYGSLANSSSILNITRLIKLSKFWPGSTININVVWLLSSKIVAFKLNWIAPLQQSELQLCLSASGSPAQQNPCSSLVSLMFQYLSSYEGFHVKILNPQNNISTSLLHVNSASPCFCWNVGTWNESRRQREKKKHLILWEQYQINWWKVLFLLLNIEYYW